MSYSKSQLYTARNKDGYLCCYDKETHLCVGVMDSTGDMPLTEEKLKEYLGQTDPKFKNK